MRAVLVLAAIALPWTWDLAAVVVKKFTVNNPTAVTVNMVSPISGSTVSGVIQLSALASSTAGPISRVEFYCDSKLIAIVNSNNVPIPLPPTSFNAK